MAVAVARWEAVSVKKGSLLEMASVRVAEQRAYFSGRRWNSMCPSYLGSRSYV